MQELVGRGIAQGAGDPVQVMVLRRQHMGLLVVQVLDAVLDPAQKVVGLGQCFGRFLRHEAGLGQPGQCAQRRAGPEFGVLAAAHHLQQLHDEFDFADAAARQLDVVGAFRAPGAAFAGMVAYLPVQYTQRVKHVVVQVAAEHERHHHTAQRQRSAFVPGAESRHHPAFQPGKALPFAALHMQVLFERPERNGRWPGIAVGPQCQVDPKDKAVLGDVANQGVERAHRFGKVLLVGNATAPLRVAGGVAVLVVNVNQVDVAGDIQLAGAEFAHADNPELGAGAVRGARRAVGLVQRQLDLRAGPLQGELRQVGHGLGDLAQGGLFIAVQTQQAFQHQLAGGAQGAAGVVAQRLQGLKGQRHGRLIRDPGG